MSTQVLTRYHEVYFDQAFAATLGPANIPVDHIVELNYGYDYQQNGATAPTLADVKGDFIHELVLTLSGREICRLDNYDVCILQNLWFGQTPQHLLSTSNNLYGYWRMNTLPLSLDKSDPTGFMRTLDVQFTVGALTDVDNCTITAGVPYKSNENVSWLPNGYHYAYQYQTFTAQTAAQMVRMDRPGADLIGLLVYSCTLPTTSNLNTSVDWLRIFVNDQPVYGPIHWEAMPTFQCTQNVLDDTTYGAELDNYAYLDFTKAPLPADRLHIETASATATDAGQKFIGVYQEA